MTTPADTPNAKAPDENDDCPRWNGAEPCHYVAQKSPSFPVFIRACSGCGRIHFGELARDLADAGYVVVPQAELRPVSERDSARTGWYEFVMPNESATTHVAYAYEDGSVYLPEGPQVVTEEDFLLASATSRCWRLVREEPRAAEATSSQASTVPPWKPWREADPTQPESKEQQ